MVVKMFCPKCGKEAKNDAKFCEHCGTEIITEKKEPQKINLKEGYVDEKGFIRKSRNNNGLVLWFAASIFSRILWNLPGEREYDILALLLWPVLAYVAFLGIKNYSSHDIDTWKHSKHVKLWIYIGCLLAGLVGIIIYYYSKGKEQKYLANAHIQFTKQE
jgi:hypothetical protein